MKTAFTITTNRPMTGLVAFVPALPMAAAVARAGGCAVARLQALPASHPLDWSEDQVHPGEGSA